MCRWMWLFGCARGGGWPSPIHPLTPIHPPSPLGVEAHIITRIIQQQVSAAGIRFSVDKCYFPIHMPWASDHRFHGVFTRWFAMQLKVSTSAPTRSRTTSPSRCT